MRGINPHRASVTPQRYALSAAAILLALGAVLGSPSHAMAASSSIWNGNSQKGTWVSAGTPYSSKVNAWGLTVFVTRVGVRVNGYVSNGSGGSIIVSYAKKKNPSIACRWDQGSTQVQPIKCVNSW